MTQPEVEFTPSEKLALYLIWGVLICAILVIWASIGQFMVATPAWYDSYA